MVAFTALFGSYLFLRETVFDTVLPAGFPDLPDLSGRSEILRELIQQADSRARSDPASDSALGRLGMVYHANLFLDQARSAYELATGLNPSGHRWYYYQALLEEEASRPDRMLESLQRSVQQRPDYLPALQKLADVLFKNGKWDRARELYHRAQALDGSFVPAALGLGRVAAYEGDWGGVLRELEPVAKKYPRLRQVHRMLADSYQHLGQPDQAERERRMLRRSDLLSDVVFSDPLREELDELCYLSTPLLKRAYAAQSRVDFEEMLRLSQRAVEANPNDADAQHFLSRALILAHGQDPRTVSEAINRRDAGLRLRPDDLEPLLLLGQALVDRGSFALAEQQLRNFLDGNSGHERARNLLGLALVGQGKMDEAVAEFTEALRVRPDYAEAHNNLGSALTRTNRLNEAAAHFRAALRFKPDYAEAHYNFANALAAAGRSSDAFVHFLRALELRPDYVQAHNDLGVVLLREGKLVRAIEHLAAALEFDPRFAQAHYNLGLIFARQGKSDKALEHFSRALEIKPDFVEAQRNIEILRKR